MVVKMSTDFKKPKLRIGYKKPTPTNLTNPNIRSKKVQILKQSILKSNDTDNTNNKILFLNECLSCLTHHNDNSRRAAAASLIDITNKYPKLIEEHMDKVMISTSNCWVDHDSSIRKYVRQFILKLLCSEKISRLSPFSSLLCMQIRGTLCHFRNDVRIDGLNFLKDFISLNLGSYKFKFHSLESILEWAPLVCKIASSASFGISIDFMYISIFTIRELIYEITSESAVYIKLKSDKYENILQCLANLYETIVNILFNIINLRRQSTYFYSKSNKSQNEFNFNSSKHRYNISEVPNIPICVPHDRDSLFTFLGCLCLDSLSCILQYNHIIEVHNLKQNIVDIIKKINLMHETLESEIPNEKVIISLSVIEKILLLRLSLLYQLKLIEKSDIDTICKLATECLQIYNIFIRNSLHFDELLINSESFVSNNIVNIILNRSIEIMIRSEIDKELIRGILSPAKCISITILSIILDLKELLDSEKLFIPNNSEVDIELSSVMKFELNRDLDKIFLSIDSDSNIIPSIQLYKLKWIFHYMIMGYSGRCEDWIDENNNPRISIFKSLIVMPIIGHKIGFKTLNDNIACENNTLNHWYGFEVIMSLFEVRISNLYSKTFYKYDKEMELQIVRLWISNIPQMIYILYQVSVASIKSKPTNIICALSRILELYIKRQVPVELPIEDLTTKVCKGLIPFLVGSSSNTKSFGMNSTPLACIPFSYQKALISTITEWPIIPIKFIKILLNKVIEDINNGTNLEISVLIIQILIINSKFEVLSFEQRFSIIITILKQCNFYYEDSRLILRSIAENITHLAFDIFGYPILQKTSEKLSNLTIQTNLISKWILPLFKKIKCEDCYNTQIIQNFCIFYWYILFLTVPINDNITINYRNCDHYVIKYKNINSFWDQVLNIITEYFSIDTDKLFLISSVSHSFQLNLHNLFLGDIREWKISGLKIFVNDLDELLYILKPSFFILELSWRSYLALLPDLEDPTGDFVKISFINSTASILRNITKHPFQKKTNFSSLFSFTCFWWLFRSLFPFNSDWDPILNNISSSLEDLPFSDILYICNFFRDQLKKSIL
ncbi:hypothetical protein cand_010910 [Cryptosporidium andersoni]|uniref:Pre-rRNA-processing protein Ipi1 N-terminal domain-containing protein n=1 Tax=Cryptosporidium andersoni TaxID=117008 RepID=A0A1J4MTW3_9CRYT|nr:hypothetical protein cand_010910 [Cryptosporidium andersoni]